MFFSFGSRTETSLFFRKIRRIPKEVRLQLKRNRSTKRMDECLIVFQNGLKHKPNDSFLQNGVKLLSNGKALVKYFHQLCHEEMKAHGTNSPYSFQHAWDRNINLAKSIIAWVLSDRVGSPQKLEFKRDGSSTKSHTTFRTNNNSNRNAESSTRFLQMLLFGQQQQQQQQNVQQHNHHPIVQPNAVIIQPRIIEHSIIGLAWRILEDMSGLQPGIGPLLVNRLTQIVSLILETRKQQLQVVPTHPQQRQPLETPLSHVMCYEPQLQVARTLLTSLKLLPGFNSEYHQVDFFIITPAKISLTVQTRERLVLQLWDVVIPPEVITNEIKSVLRQLIIQTLNQRHQPSILNRATRYDAGNAAWDLLDHIQAVLDRKVVNSLMFRNGESNKAFQDLSQAIFCTNPQTGKRNLVLVIADECHHAIQRNGQVDILFNGAHHKNGTCPNPLNILCEPNVFIINVSATGWNSSVAIPQQNVLQWNSSNAAGGGYISLDSYTRGKNRHKVLVSKQFDALVQRYGSAVNGELKTLLPSVILMVDYACAFLNTVDTSGRIPSATPETTSIIQHMIATTNGTAVAVDSDETDTILVRVQRNGVQNPFAWWLKTFRPMMLLSLSTPTGSSPPPRLYQIACLSSTGGSSESEIPVNARDTFDTTLRGHHSICIVVEKGRMADTIPGISFFDLRPRYSNATSSLASFLQDAGRCFGYRAMAPVMILNQQGHRLLIGDTAKIDHYLQPGPMTRMFVPAPRSMWSRVITAAAAAVVNTGSHESVQAKKAFMHTQSNRLLLLAEPQIGKTGAFIKLIELVLQDKQQ